MTSGLDDLNTCLLTAGNNMLGNDVLGIFEEMAVRISVNKSSMISQMLQSLCEAQSGILKQNTLGFM